MSYAALFDPGLSGFIGNLPDRTSDVLRLLCGLNLIAFVMMISALKPVYVGRFCHTSEQDVSARIPSMAVISSLLTLV